MMKPLRYISGKAAEKCVPWNLIPSALTYRATYPHLLAFCSAWFYRRLVRKQLLATWGVTISKKYICVILMEHFGMLSEKYILAFSCAYSLHRVRLFLALWTVARQFPLSTDSSGKKVPTGCGLPFPSPSSTCRNPNYLWKFVNCFAKKPSIPLSWYCVEIHYAVHFWTDWENFLSLL